MALQLPHTLPDGSSGHYWKIVSYDVDLWNRSLCIRIGLYKDLPSRQDKQDLMLDDKLLSIFPLFFAGEDFSAIHDYSVIQQDGNPVKQAYRHLKTLLAPVDFTRAYDV